MNDKSIFFRLPKTGKEGFLVENDRMPFFYDKLHYHPDLQLKYIVEGSGDLFVGDTFIQFEAGDLCMIGANKFDIMKSDTTYYVPASGLNALSRSVIYLCESLGKDLF